MINISEEDDWFFSEEEAEADRIRRMATRKLLQDRYPSMFWVPNVGQEKYLRLWEKAHVPSVVGMFTGNGVGKTTVLVAKAIDLGWNGKFSNPDWFNAQHHRFWQDGKISIRIVGDGADFKPKGGFYAEWVKLAPKGHWGWIRDGGAIVGVRLSSKVEIQFRTFGQDLTAHAGTNNDVILVNEPMPEQLWYENVGRLRNGFPGVIHLFATPLNVSPWMYDAIVENEDGHDKVVITAPIWDNCRDIAGTRGVLPREKIEMMIREWRAKDPEEAEARETGKFKHLAGRIYKNFDDEVHVIKPFNIPADWPVYMVIDPHDTRPPAVAWFAQSPLNQYYCIAEYPTGDYLQMNGDRMTVQVHAQKILQMERQKMRSEQVKFKRMDPNKGNTRSSHTGKTMVQMWSGAGIKCRADINDDLDYGHKSVNELLWYDNRMPRDDFNCPRLYIFEGCRNVRNALKKYGYKKDSDTKSGSLTSKVEQTYKDFADTVRYFAVSRMPFQKVGASGMNDQAKIAAQRFGLRSKK